jgi:hypothetical protein
MGFPEQTGLQSRLHHVERAGNDGSGHATDTEDGKRVRVRTSGVKGRETHAPPTKCCQDLAGIHFDRAVSDIGDLMVTEVREG